VRILAAIRILSSLMRLLDRIRGAYMVPVLLCCLATGSVVEAQSARAGIELVRVARIGDSESDVQFGRVAAAAFATGDRLIVADGAFNTIASFDSSGRGVATAGREGRGPLEFSMLEWIGACGPNELVAFDLLARRFTVLGEDLTYRAAFSVTGAPSGLVCTPSGHVAYLEAAFDLEPTNAREWHARARLKMLRANATAPQVIDTVALGDLVQLNGAWMVHPGGRRSSLVPIGAGIGVASGGADPIAVYDTLGRRTTSVVVPRGSRELTAAEQRSVAEEFMSRIPTLAAREQMVQALLATRRESIAVGYRRALAAPDGSIWLQRSFRGGAQLEVEVITPSGQRIARLTLPGDGELLAVGRARVAVLRSTTDGADVVELFAIRGG